MPTRVYYRTCLFSCDLINAAFDGAAATLIPDAVFGKPILFACDGCEKTNCNSIYYSTDDPNNSAVVTKTILLWSLSSFIVSFYI